MVDNIREISHISLILLYKRKKGKNVFFLKLTILFKCFFSVFQILKKVVLISTAVLLGVIMYQETFWYFILMNLIFQGYAGSAPAQDQLQRGGEENSRRNPWERGV